MSSEVHPFLSLHENGEAGLIQQRDNMPWLAFDDREPNRESPWNALLVMEHALRSC